MPIDASIISGIRPAAPVQMDDPISSYAKVATLKQLLGQGKLQDLQAEQARMGMEDERGARDALRIASAGGALDNGAYLRELGSRGLAKQFQAAQKADLEATKTKAETAHQNASAAQQQLKVYSHYIPTLNTPEDAAGWVQAQHKDSVLGPILQGAGTAEQAIARIPRDPAGFARWKFEQQEGMAKYAQKLQEDAKIAETARHNPIMERASLTSAGAAAAQAGNAAQRLKFDREQADRPIFDPASGAFYSRPTPTAGPTQIPITAPGGGVVPNPKNREDADGIRKEFTALPEVKSYKEVVPIIRSAVKAPNTSQGDIDLIYAMGKIMDPNSVVREGEMAMAQKSGSPEDRIKGTISYLQGGGRMSPAARAKLVEVLSGRVGELEKSYGAARGTYEALAKKRGYDPEDIFVNLPPTSASAPTPAAKAVRIKGDDGYNALPKGARYVGPDGIERTKP